MAATCALTARPDLFHVCNKGRSVRRRTRLRYKEFFATGSVRCADILYLRRSPRNIALVHAHRGLNSISGAIQSVLDLIGLKDRVKKLLHYEI